MIVIQVIATLAAVCLMLYLLVALLRPEIFS